MIHIKINHPKLLKVGLALVGWTMYGLFFASQNYIRQVSSNRPANWSNDLVVWMTCGSSWALLTPVILFFARHFPPNRRNWLRTLAIHLPAAVLFSLVQLAVYTGLRLVLHGKSLTYSNLVADELHSGVLVYFAILGVSYVVTYLFSSESYDSDIATTDVSASSNGAGNYESAIHTTPGNGFQMVRENGA
ncbi:MAG TPA: hypothetical protein VNA17_02775, partial [Pyrinomonadaceae bacterium]|nr:hypothetical protein [Pyrinomonadaceae bacterium]